MAYRTTALQLMISCPSDVEEEDKDAIRRAITRWNVLHGEAQEHVIVPLSWTENTSAQFGAPPQKIVDQQITDVVDLAIVIFWGRLGQPTESAPSGTADEIKTLHGADKPISVLRCAKPVPVDGNHEERARLEKYLDDEIKPNGLLRSYPTATTLEQEVDTILTHMVRQHEQTWGEPSGRPGRAGQSQVVAKINAWSESETDSKSRLKTKRRQELVFTNEGGRLARKINWRLELLEDEEDGGLPFVGGNNAPSGTIPSLGPNGGSVSYPLLSMASVASQVMCYFDWEEDGKERHGETTISP